ncbi:MAG: type IV secretion system protein, partial [Phenylobacterium sp.]|nr:type IV secretion system protein [Phenylobacterium sp.]
MDEPFEVFGPAYLFVDERLELFLSDRMGVMTAELAPAVRSALVLYVTLYGIAIVRGAITEPVLDFAVRSLKLAIVSLLSTTVAYQTYVTDP